MYRKISNLEQTKTLFTLIKLGVVKVGGVDEGRLTHKAMKKKRTLNELRQVKDSHYKPKQYTGQLCIEQTDKVSKKILELVEKAVAKLNNGTSDEKLMAVGIIQLVNEIEILCKYCPNNSDLGKNIQENF